MWTFTLWSIAVIVAILYCSAKASIDLRARRYAWGIVGLFSAAVLLLVPMPTRAIKVDLPIAGQ